MSFKLRMHHRFLPLYIAAFFQGFVLWYTIEKMFMQSIGFSDAQVGWMIAIYSVIVLLVETPSGIMADRWSRKGVLIIGSIFLALATLIGGLSNDIGMYIFSAAFWGVFFAMYSGTYESLVYDSLLEEEGNADDYEKYYGRITIFDSLGLVLGSVVGGIIAEVFGMRATYFLTIPLALISIGALLRFREPSLHEHASDASLTKHVKATFVAVARQRILRPVLAVLLLNGIIGFILYELSQLWLIALAVPLLSIGVANAILLSTFGLGGIVAKWLKLYEYRLLLVGIGVMLLSTLGLIFTREPLVVIAAQVLLGVGTVALEIVFTKFLHDELPSAIRTGAASAVSSITRVFFVPVILLFTYVSDVASIFKASWIFFVLVLLAGVFVIRTLATHRKLPDVVTADAARVGHYNK